MGGPSMVRRLVFCTASDGGRQRYFLCWLVLVWLSPLRSDASSFTPWVESTCRVEASNFLFAKKKVTKEIAWERGVAGRYIGPSIHFASLVPLSAWPRRSHRICFTPTLEIWDIGAPTASRSAGWKINRAYWLD